MSEEFKLEIISPEKTLMQTDAKQVTIPAFEGEMTLLKDHISLITFLRPGVVSIVSNNNLEKFYVEEGTVEFYDNKLLILSSSIINIKDLSNDQISLMIEETKKKINDRDLKDKDRYVLAHKENTLNNFN